MSLLDLHIDHIVRLHQHTQPFVSTIQHQRLDRAIVDAQVKAAIAACPDTSATHWEIFLRHELVEVAANEGDAVQRNASAYYDALCNMLDFILTATEHGVCDDVVIWAALEDLLRVQTVETCSHIFSWIEARAARLTVNLDPRKSKGLALLRTLNELLSRLSKTGKTTTFCGRILLFLSSVFELGERSGVNLRGDYGPEWDPVPKPPRTTPLEELSPEARQVEERKEEFFREFWSFQTPFTRPQKFSLPETFPAFQAAVDAVLPQLSEATSRERALMGSKALNGTSAAVAAGTKRKREDVPDKDDANRKKEYFFAKFLTSPELLELEIMDPQFRRQFLFQLLILLQHLMNFDVKKQAENKKLSANLQLGGFTLSEEGMTWVRDKWRKIVEELKAIAPGGRSYTDVIMGILTRENNWIKWKNTSCPAFDMPPLPPAFTKSARIKRRKLLEPPPPPQWSHGSAGLTEMWDTGYDDIERAMEADADVGTLKHFARTISNINKRIAQREMMAARNQQKVAPPPAATSGDEAAKPKPPPPPPRPKIVDPVIKSQEEERVKTTWLALRIARTNHLHVLGDMSKDKDKDKEAAGKEKEKDSKPPPVKVNDPNYLPLLSDAVDADERAWEKQRANSRGRDSKTETSPGVEADVKMEEDTAESKQEDTAESKQEDTAESKQEETTAAASEPLKSESAEPMDQDPPTAAVAT